MQIYDWFVNITLFSFCIVDTKFYKVRNDMIISAIVAYIIFIIMSYGTTNQIICEIIKALSIFVISQVVLSILSMILTVSYGDIKLIGVILSILGLNDGLYTVFLGSCFSLFLIYRKTVEKLPMGYVFYIGYLIHFFFKGVLV